MRGRSAAGLACAGALVLTGMAVAPAAPRCTTKRHCVSLPDRGVRPAFAALLTASERPGFSDRVRFPTLTELFGADGPAAYQAIDAALLGALRAPATARAAAASSGTAGSVGWTADGAASQGGANAGGPLTDNGSFRDTATDTDSTHSSERLTNWRVKVGQPCPDADGIVRGTARGETIRRVSVNPGTGAPQTISARIVVDGGFNGYVTDGARLHFTSLRAQVNVNSSSGNWQGRAAVQIGDGANDMTVSGADAADIAGDGASQVLMNVVTAAAERALRRAERMWRTPNRCAKLKLTAAPPVITTGQQSKVKAKALAYDGHPVRRGRVKATASGASVAPGHDVTAADGIARFTVTARSDAAALVTHLTSRAGIARAAISLGKPGSFTATLQAVRTDKWATHVTYTVDSPPKLCTADSNGIELIKTPPENLVSGPVYYSSDERLGFGFLGYMVLNRNGTATDSCSGNADTSDCGADFTFDTLTTISVTTKGDFVEVDQGHGWTNRPRISCPSYGGTCNVPDPPVVNTPAPLPRAALRDPGQKTITLRGSTSQTWKHDCNEVGAEQSEQDEIKWEWTITLVRR